MIQGLRPKRKARDGFWRGGSGPRGASWAGTGVRIDSGRGLPRCHQRGRPGGPGTHRVRDRRDSPDSRERRARAAAAINTGRAHAELTSPSYMIRYRTEGKADPVTGATGPPSTQDAAKSIIN